MDTHTVSGRLKVKKAACTLKNKVQAAFEVV